MGEQPKSEASSLSFAEARRLWEEPTEETKESSPQAGGEDVNDRIAKIYQKSFQYLHGRSSPTLRLLRRARSQV
jgi:hypothetical protein